MRCRLTVGSRLRAVLGGLSAVARGALPQRSGTDDDVGAGDRARRVLVRGALVELRHRAITRLSGKITRAAGRLTRVRDGIALAGGAHEARDGLFARQHSSAADVAAERVGGRIDARREVLVAGILGAISRRLITLSARLICVGKRLIAGRARVICLRKRPITRGKRRIGHKPHGG